MDETTNTGRSNGRAEADWTRLAVDKSTEFFDHAPLGICIAKPTRIVACNGAFAGIFGFASVEDAIGVDLSAIYPDENGRTQFLAQLLRDRRIVQHRAMLRARDGRLVHVIASVVGQIDADGALAEIRCYILDDTASVEAERAMREREQLLQAVFFDASDSILLLDDRRIVVEANPAAAALFGREVEQIAGEPLDSLIVESAETWDKTWRELLALGETKREHLVARADGPRVVECGYRARVHTGRHLCIARDITDRRLLDDRLAQAARIESVGRLAGGIAHDFNNLLTAILGYTELLLSHHPAGDPEHDDLEEIQKAGKRASVLTQQLLAFGRRQVLQPQELDLNRTITAAQAMLRHVLPEDIVLTIELARSPALVMVDPGQIEQVVVNLVLNSRDALPMGGSIEIQLSQVTMSPADLPSEHRGPPGAYVRLRVIDNGSGISPAVREHLFEPFFTTKEQGKGSGLGLASVYGIVHQSGGFIVVDNPPRGGTMFSLYFPAILSAAAVEAKAVNPVSTGRETLLLVEDEDAVRAVIGALLRRNGYNVLEAATPRGACEIFQTHSHEIALLVTDVVMPEMNGLALAQRFVADKSDLRVLFISGYADAVPLAKLTGANVGFLGKPFPASSLTRAIRDLLDVTSPSPTP